MRVSLSVKDKEMEQINPLLLAEMFVFGCTVDYVEEQVVLIKVINPNATASCGCGESFAVWRKK